MEYLLFAFNDSQSSTKFKLSKLRHLDSLFFFLLIVALIFFQIFQNHQLREELLSRKGDYMMEEILNERIPELQRQIEELRSYINEQNGKIMHKIDENKELTLALGRQLGLPIRDIDEQVPSLPQKTDQQQENEINSFQVIQIQPCRKDYQQTSEQGDYPNGQLGQQYEQYEHTPQQSTWSRGESQSSCSYIDYLKEWEEEIANDFRPSNLNYQKRSFVKVKSYNYQEQYLEQIKKLTISVGKAILIVVLVIAILMFTFNSKNKGKQTKSYLKTICKKICFQEKKRTIKQEKQLLHL